MKSIVELKFLESEFIQSSVAEINKSGFCVIPGFFSTEIVKEAVASVEREIQIHGKEYFSIRWHQYLSDSLLLAIRNDDGFKLMLTKILETANALPDRDQEVHSVLRVSIGERSKLGTNKLLYMYNVLGNKK